MAFPLQVLNSADLFMSSLVLWKCCPVYAQLQDYRNDQKFGRGIDLWGLDAIYNILNIWARYFKEEAGTEGGGQGEERFICFKCYCELPQLQDD